MYAVGNPEVSLFLFMGKISVQEGLLTKLYNEVHLMNTKPPMSQGFYHASKYKFWNITDLLVSIDQKLILVLFLLWGPDAY